MESDARIETNGLPIPASIMLESSVERLFEGVGNACSTSLLQEERCNRKAIYGTVLVPRSHDFVPVF